MAERLPGDVTDATMTRNRSSLCPSVLCWAAARVSNATAEDLGLWSLDDHDVDVVGVVNANATLAGVIKRCI